MNNEQETTEKTADPQPNDAAGLLFSGKVKIFDVETGEVLIEQRSE